jgi:hypothetical protein
VLPDGGVRRYFAQIYRNFSSISGEVLMLYGCFQPKVGENSKIPVEIGGSFCSISRKAATGPVATLVDSQNL